MFVAIHWLFARAPAGDRDGLGCSAASIRERIYASVEGSTEIDMAGLMLYTAAPDSEGTLGGFVELGEAGEAGPLLEAEPPLK